MLRCGQRSHWEEGGDQGRKRRDKDGGDTRVAAAIMSLSEFRKGGVDRPLFFQSSDGAVGWAY